MRWQCWAKRSTSATTQAAQVEELDRTRHLQPETRAGQRPAFEQDGEAGRDSTQPITALEVPRRAPLGVQLGTMRRQLDHLPLAVRALMARDAVSTVEEPQLHVVGHQRQRALAVLRRHRVAVGVEADEGLAVHIDRDHQICVR